MYVNIIESYRKVVAICDEELIGKRFQEGIKQLYLKESFYKGEKGKKVNEEELTKIMKESKMEDATFNIVGNKSIKTAIKAKTIDEKTVSKIDNIPYALVLI